MYELDSMGEVNLIFWKKIIFLCSPFVNDPFSQYVMVISVVLKLPAILSHVLSYILVFTRKTN